MKIASSTNKIGCKLDMAQLAACRFLYSVSVFSGQSHTVSKVKIQVIVKFLGCTRICLHFQK
jgi:hypothetical protein